MPPTQKLSLFAFLLENLAQIRFIEVLVVGVKHLELSRLGYKKWKIRNLVLFRESMLKTI